MLAAALWACAVPALAQQPERLKEPLGQEKKEARRPETLKLRAEISQAGGYESNPRRGGDRVGDSYLESTAYLLLSRKLTPDLRWHAAYYLSFQNYLEYGDGDYSYQSFVPSRFIRRLGKYFRLEAELELGDLYFPKASQYDYRWVNPALQVRHDLPAGFFHAFRTEWELRSYGLRKAREGDGTNSLTSREDTRYRLRYELGWASKRTLLQVRQEWYENDSNDARNDSYDAQDYKLTASARREVNGKLSLNASYSFERRNYSHRTVTGITPEARYDDTHLCTLSGDWQLSRSWSLNAAYSYRSLDSNDPKNEYVDVTYSAGVTARL